jgi:ubiquinone/menaquinone biosynthesis C-methylase UbiE
MMQEADLAACCAVSYSHPVTRWLMGDSLHPGRLALTTRLGQLANIGPDSVVLDAGSGQGTSAVHLASTTGCRVVGITLEQEGVAAGERLAEGQDLQALVSFRQGNLLEVPLETGSFDVVLMECVLSILPDKPAALYRLRGALRPGGRLAVTDVTVN